MQCIGTYDWLSFFWGGAVGSFVILSVEKLFEYSAYLVKRRRERIELEKAMSQEVKENLKLCETIITSLEAKRTQIHLFANFDCFCIKKYAERFIDYSNKDSMRLLSFLYGTQKLMEQIHVFENNLSMLAATSRALLGFSKHVEEYNSKILKFTYELQSSSLAMQSCRKKNKISKKDLDKYIELNQIHFKPRENI